MPIKLALSAYIHFSTFIIESFARWKSGPAPEQLTKPQYHLACAPSQIRLLKGLLCALSMGFVPFFGRLRSQIQGEVVFLRNLAFPIKIELPTLGLAHDSRPRKFNLSGLAGKHYVAQTPAIQACTVPIKPVLYTPFTR